jgi:ABC-type transporter Mla subunit MlaD
MTEHSSDTLTVMDDAERDRLLDTLRTDEDFRASVRRELLTEELLDLPNVVAGLARNVADLARNVADLARNVADLGGDTRALFDAIADQRQDFNALTAEAAAQRQDLTALAGATRDYMERTISAIQGGFAALSEHVGEVRTDVAALRTDVEAGISALRTDVTKGFSSVGAEMDQLRASIREITPPG